MATIASVRANPTAEVEGVWHGWQHDIRVRVARMWNARFDEVSAKLTEPYQAEAQAGTLADDIREAIMLEAMADAVLVDWCFFDWSDDEGEPLIVVEAGLADHGLGVGDAYQKDVGDGITIWLVDHEDPTQGLQFRKIEAGANAGKWIRQIPYSKAKALEFLQDERLNSFRMFVRTMSVQAANYTEAATQEAAKN